MTTDRARCPPVEPTPRRVAFANITPNWFASRHGHRHRRHCGGQPADRVSRASGLGRRDLVARRRHRWSSSSIATVAHWRKFPATARAHHRRPGARSTSTARCRWRCWSSAPARCWPAATSSALRAARRSRLGAVVRRHRPGLGHGRGRPVPHVHRRPRPTAGVDAVDAAFGGWLMPVVPPMVSAATGALLVPYAPAGQARLCLLVGCYAMFGLSLIASLIVITLIWAPAGHAHGRRPAAAGADAVDRARSDRPVDHRGQPARRRRARCAAPPVRHRAAGVRRRLRACRPGASPCCGWRSPRRSRCAQPGRTCRSHSTWWSFTFPVGTVVTGTSALALHTGADLFRYGAAVGYAGAGPGLAGRRRAAPPAASRAGALLAAPAQG